MSDLREAFEAYFSGSRKSKGAGRSVSFDLLPDNTYADDHTQRHWWTWQNALAAQAQDSPWKQAIDSELVTIGRTADSYPSAPDALRAVLDWRASVMLDPAVSSDAQKLIDQGVAMAAQTQAEPVLCINPKVLDPTTGKVRAGSGALTYSDAPCAGWSMPLYATPQPAAQAEPVKCERCGHDNWIMDGKAPAQITKADRAQAKPVRNPLTDEQLEHIRQDFRRRNYPVTRRDFDDYARAIERAHGITGDKG